MKYITNIEVHYVGYLYIMDLIDARKMEYIKFKNEVYVSQILEVCSIIQTTKTLHILFSIFTVVPCILM
jgi:hypothetical protein